MFLLCFRPAPCVPQNVTTKLDCPSGSLNVSWDLQGRTPNEIIIIILDNGRTIIIFSCKLGTSGNNCGVPNVPCGKNYDVKLLSKEPKCNSSFSTPKPLSAGGSTNGQMNIIKAFKKIVKNVGAFRE